MLAKTKRSLSSQGTLLMVLAALCWSTAGLFIRFIEADPWTIVLWRSAILAVTLFAALAFRLRSRTFGAFRALGWPGFWSAVLLATTFGLFVGAITQTTVANTLVIMAASPFAVALLGWAFLGERPARATWVAMTVVMAGIAVMFASEFGGGHLAGNLLALLVVIAFGANTLIVRRYRNVDMVPAVCLGGVLSAVTALPFAPSLGVSAIDFACLLGLGVVQLGLGLALFVAAARRLPAADVSLLGSLETVLGPLWVWISVGERPSNASFFGGGLVLVTLLVYTARMRARTPT